MARSDVSREQKSPLGQSFPTDDVFVPECDALQRQRDVQLASGRHLLDLVTKLLDLEGVELGKMESSPQLVNLAELLKEVRDVLRTSADKSGITVSVTTDLALSAVLADAVRLRQIAYNYLSNAIKFVPVGSVVHLQAVPEGAAKFRIEAGDAVPWARPL